MEGFGARSCYVHDSRRCVYFTSQQLPSDVVDGFEGARGR